MEYYSIKNDFYYEIGGSVTSRSFAIYDGDEIIYTGRAVKRPDGNIRINVGRIVRDYLENEMPDFREYDGDIVVHPYAMKTFSLVNSENGETMETYKVLMDYEDEWNGSDMVLNEPINTHADPRQKIFYGGYSQSEKIVVITTKDSSGGTDYYFDLLTPAYHIIGSAVTSYTISWVTNYQFVWYTYGSVMHSTSNTSVTITFPENDTEEDIMHSVTFYDENSVQLGSVSWKQEHYVPFTYYFTLLTPSDQVISSSATSFNIIWDTNYPSIRYSYNRAPQETTTESGVTITFPVNSAESQCLHYVDFYNTSGSSIGTIEWYQDALSPYYFRFTCRDGLYLSSATTRFDVSWDTNYTYITYEYQEPGYSKRWGSTPDSSILITFNQHETATHTFTAMSPDGDVLGTLKWYQGEDPYNSQYLTLVILSGGTIVSHDDIMGTTRPYYSLDSGQTWTQFSGNPFNDVINVNAGDRVLLKGDGGVHGSLSGSTAWYNAEGNIMSLCYGDNFVGQDVIERSIGEFFRNSNLVSAENLVLPAELADPSTSTSPSGSYYYGLFCNCRELLIAPKVLPSQNLTNECYALMFANCVKLEMSPMIMGTTTIGSVPCSAMFAGDSSLWWVYSMLVDFLDVGTDCMNWLRDVPNGGVFVKDVQNNDWYRDDDGIPFYWTIINVTRTNSY